MQFRFGLRFPPILNVPGLYHLHRLHQDHWKRYCYSHRLKICLPLLFSACRLTFSPFFCPIQPSTAHHFASIARMKANSGVLESPGQARSFATSFIAIRTELMDKFRKSSVLSKKGTCPKKGTGTYLRGYQKTKTSEP